jgi:hypothetical protein
MEKFGRVFFSLSCIHNDMYRLTNKESHRYVTKRNRKTTNSEKNQHKPPNIVPELEEQQSENVGAASQRLPKMVQ